MESTEHPNRPRYKSPSTLLAARTQGRAAATTASSTPLPPSAVRADTSGSETQPPSDCEDLEEEEDDDEGAEARPPPTAAELAATLTSRVIRERFGAGRGEEGLGGRVDQGVVSAGWQKRARLAHRVGVAGGGRAPWQPLGGVAEWGAGCGGPAEEERKRAGRRGRGEKAEGGAYLLT